MPVDRQITISINDKTKSARRWLLGAVKEALTDNGKYCKELEKHNNKKTKNPPDIDNIRDFLKKVEAARDKERDPSCEPGHKALNAIKNLTTAKVVNQTATETVTQ